MLKAKVVRSNTGRDRGKLYYVFDEADGFLLLVDGKQRKIESPKRKNIRHVEVVTGVGETEVSKKIISGERLANVEIRRSLSDIVEMLSSGERSV